MIDIDNLFEQFFKKYIAENLGEMTEEEIEDKIPELYAEFGDTPNDKLGGKSPRNYLKGFSDDELSTYAVNMLGKEVEVNELERFVDIITDNRAGESLTEALTELLRDNGDKVKEKVLAEYSDDVFGKGNLIEIMSGMSQDDRVFKILLNELNSDDKNIALNAGYIARYGDERAIADLEKLIEKDGISYYDFKELKNAVEELGGEYKGSKFTSVKQIH